MEIDILSRVQEKEIKCLDHGFVRIVDIMPRIVDDSKTADSAIVQMARTSYGEGTKTINQDRGLIRTLIRNLHTSPLEGVEFKFHIRLPIFVMRQLIRHRTASVNEYSARYSIMKEEFYFPDLEQVRSQSAVNKQGRGDSLEEDLQKIILNKYGKISKICYNIYNSLIEKGLAREIARCILPVNYYTECYWKIDLNNLLKTLLLRTDPHAQYEIRVFANAMESFLKDLCPIVYEAYIDYMKESIRLSRMEKKIISEVLNLNKKMMAMLAGPEVLHRGDIEFYLEKIEYLLSEECLKEKGMSAREEIPSFYTKLGIGEKTEEEIRAEKELANMIWCCKEAKEAKEG